jgi:predicted SnoaL-like aldol condensation-catalyzing enzyme
MTQVKNVSELNKLKVRLFVEAVWNQGRLDLIDELVAADYLGHFPCSERAVAGPEGVCRLVSDHRRADPGLYVKIMDQIAEDDRVVTCWQTTTAAPGTPGAGRLANYTGISVIRLLAGRQVESHTECTVSPPARSAGRPRT